jgi:hypothetical protein
MDIFPINEARESGQYCRELSRWITDTYAAGNHFRRVNRDATPISEAVRELNHESFIIAASSAIKARRERNCILRSMGRHPGFTDGYKKG